MQALFLVLLLFSSTGHALNVVSTDGSTVSSQPYISSFNVQNQDSYEQSLMNVINNTVHDQTINPDTLIYPATSDLTQGVVLPANFSTQGLSQSIFVVGDDPQSIQWAMNNAVKLKKLHALGIITNVQTAERVTDIENKTGFSLLPMSLTGLSPLVHTTHYPFLWTSTGVTQ